MFVAEYCIHHIVLGPLQAAVPLHTFPQLDLTVKWSLYHARMSFHRHELGMSWPSETRRRGMVVEGREDWLEGWKGEYV
jgi:hypothetical protein